MHELGAWLVEGRVHLDAWAGDRQVDAKDEHHERDLKYDGRSVVESWVQYDATWETDGVHMRQAGLCTHQPDGQQLLCEDGLEVSLGAEPALVQQHGQLPPYSRAAAARSSQ